MKNPTIHTWAVATLYPKNLYDFTKNILDTAEDISEKSTERIENKAIIVLVNRIAKQEKELLEKILKACNYTLNDIALIPLQGKKWELDLKLENKKTILIFGIAREQISFIDSLYDFIERKENGHIFLSAPDLERISKAPNLKQCLWKSLQKIFLLS